MIRSTSEEELLIKERLFKCLEDMLCIINTTINNAYEDGFQDGCEVRRCLCGALIDESKPELVRAGMCETCLDAL